MPLQAEDSTFMMALGALTSLTHLSMAVVPAKSTTPPFTINIASLAGIAGLQVCTGCP
jgi:hypothetical protein